VACTSWPELADRWGFRATDEGKVVWAEIDLS
jgi:hypothetical protein